MIKFNSFLMTAAILLVAISSAGQVIGKFTDARDNRTYKMVTIGTQTWMAENLAFKANSGCWAYDNDEYDYVKDYGYLYDWTTAKKVCPAGWHLPTDKEWLALIAYLGSGSIAAGKLKETMVFHWKAPNTKATNESRFSAFPGGLFDSSEKGGFGNINESGFWWSATEVSSTEGNGYELDYDYQSKDSELGDFYVFSKKDGLSVRCIKD
jgi:uncharacterized protein (TIGR02145 family)